MPFDNSAVAKQITLRGYDFVQTVLQWNERGAALPVTIVDIGAVPTVDAGNPFAPGVTATARPALLTALKAVVAHKPAAVGVDIDLSPDEAIGGFVTPGDPEFFAAVVELSRTNGVPVFLGVERTAALAPESWLGDPAYTPLAASLVIPRDSTRYQYRWTRGDTGNGIPCKTLSARLADTYKRAAGGGVPDASDVPVILRWAVQLRPEQSPAPALEEEHFAVDYAPLPRLRRDVNQLAAVSTLRDGDNDPLRGRAVILGDMRNPAPTDRFAVGSGNDSVPGALIHACAAYTLIAAPLYDLTDAGRLALDIGLGLLILGAVVAVRLYRIETDAPGGEDDALLERVEKRWLIGVAVGAFVTGVLFVGATRTLWDDFPLVILGLFTDKPLETALSKLWHRFRSGRHEKSATKPEGHPYPETEDAKDGDTQ